MPFHVLVYTKSDTAATNNEDYPGVSDQWAPVDAANHYTLQYDTKLMAAYHQNAGATNARINTPTLRYIQLPSIQPVNVTAAPVTLSPICWYGDQYLSLPKLDPIAFEASNGGAGGVRGIGAIWVRAGDNQFTPGNIITARLTGAITANTLTWTFGTMAFDQTLPYGRYQIVGMDIIGTNLVFGRLVFAGGANIQGMRPGVLARPSTLIYQWEYFRRGNAGLFGVFDSTAPPGLEIFSNGANTAQTVFLDLIRIS